MFFLVGKLNLSMDFHQKFIIALHLEDLKFLNFWLLSPNHCCHGSTTHFKVTKTFYIVYLFVHFHEIFKMVAAMKTLKFLTISLCFLDASRLWGVCICDAILSP